MTAASRSSTWSTTRCCSPSEAIIRWRGGGPSKLDDLAAESWIAGSAKASDSLLGPWQWAEWRPRVAVIAKEWTGKLGLVAAGLGVTLVPGLAASAVRRDVALVRIRSERPASREVSLATPAGRGRAPFRRTVR